MWTSKKTESVKGEEQKKEDTVIANHCKILK